MNKNYQLYISHSWTFNPEACKKKIEFFNKAGMSFQFHEAFHEEPSKSGYSEETYLFHIEAKMKNCNCMLVLAGTNEEQNYWTMKEIELAKKFGIPIVAIEPWQTFRTMPFLKSKADVFVKWHGKMITDAIKSIV